MKRLTKLFLIALAIIYLLLSLAAWRGRKIAALHIGGSPAPEGRP